MKVKFEDGTVLEGKLVRVTVQGVEVDPPETSVTDMTLEQAVQQLLSAIDLRGTENAPATSMVYVSLADVLNLLHVARQNNVI